MEITKDGILAELNNMKSALETSISDKTAESIKNVDEKIDALNSQIESLKNRKSEVSAEELSSIKAEVSAVIKGFDLLQTRQKTETVKKSSTLKSAIAEAMVDNQSSIASVSKDKAAKMTLKDVGDMTIAGNLDGSIPNTYRPGIVPLPYEMMHARNLFSVTPSETDSYVFYQHVAGEGAVAFQTNENSSKAQLDADLVEQTVNLNYLAGFIRVSRKMLKNFTALRSHVSRWLPEEYYKSEDEQAQSALSSATGVADSTGVNTVERIVRTIGLQKQAHYNVNLIVVDGKTWSDILLTKGATSGDYTMPGGSIVITAQGQVLICGIPVYTATWVGEGQVLVGDSRFFEIIQSEGLALGFFDQDANNVTQNKVTVRIEASVGFALLDPKAFAWVDAVTD
jgi:HK97 family phage major capsid protein